jgi:uncharacterized coiled-coil protein SlyX
MQVSSEDYEDAMYMRLHNEDKMNNRLGELEKAHQELEQHVLELANLVMDQQKVLAELTKHLIALSQEKETDNEVR